jgi:toxin ParE1/3/4
MPTIIVGRLAAIEVAEAHAWYEAKQPGLGAVLLDEIDAAFKRIENGPLRYAVVLADGRRALVRRFPYAIYFRVRGDEIRVVGVIHQHRDPAAGRERFRATTA